MVSLFLCISTCEWFSSLPLICALGPATAAWFDCVFFWFFLLLFISVLIVCILFFFPFISPSRSPGLFVLLFCLYFFLSMRVMKSQCKMFGCRVFVCLIKTKLLFFFWFTYNLESLTKYPMNHGQKH